MTLLRACCVYILLVLARPQRCAVATAGAVLAWHAEALREGG